MKKEESRFSDSCIFEGMTSIRAVISAGENGISDRRIEKLLIDKGKQKSKAKEIGWLKFKSGEMGFGIEFVEAEELVEVGEIEPENVMTPGILVDYIVIREGK